MPGALSNTSETSQHCASRVFLKCCMLARMEQSTVAFPLLMGTIPAENLKSLPVVGLCSHGQGSSWETVNTQTHTEVRGPLDCILVLHLATEQPWQLNQTVL